MAERRRQPSKKELIHEAKTHATEAILLKSVLLKAIGMGRLDPSEVHMLLARTTSELVTHAASSDEKVISERMDARDVAHYTIGVSGQLSAEILNSRRGQVNG